eukprot:TRINITY_DN6644_c0_g2_i1.p1 TRINITY_DN6644_c0_g2~~TRINITY_DN6644_c0_g2_i1.p1  ORF type:complete len:409 (+),score=147.22 TRINITY_DN6644_c0_g2_i1:814-2040(+)
MIPENAKEVSNNWFLKTAIIREVVPRCYVEICLAKCYFFVSDTPIKITLERIAKSIRGVSEPLVAIYLSVFLERIGQKIVPNEKGYLIILFENAYIILEQAKKIGFTGSPLDDYLSCFDMAVHWIVGSVCRNSSPALYEKILATYLSKPPNNMILKYIIMYSPAECVSADAAKLFDIIKAMPKPEQAPVLAELAAKFMVEPPQSKRMRLEFMNHSWTLSKEVENGATYMSLVIALTEFAMKYLKIDKVAFLEEIFQKCKAFLDSSAEIQSVLCEALEKLLLKVIGTSSSLTEVLSIDSLIPLFDYFAPAIKKKLCRMVLNTVLKSASVVSDAVTAHTIMELGKIVHDSVDFLTSESEVESVGELLKEIMMKIDFGRDLEQQIKLLTQARGIFINFDPVIDITVRFTHP